MESMSDIVAQARDEYTVHECRECTYRKSCDLNSHGFGSAECLSRRVSISLMLGIEDSYFTKLLDDIEAAAARERGPGNAAAMREALTDISRGLETKMKDCPASVTAHEMAIYRRCEAALSAPARNCDLPLVVDGPADNNADKAWLIFKRHNPDVYFDVPGLLRCIDWLLAPAAERKVEGDV